MSESVSSREEWIGLARRAEDLGYVTFLVVDHYVNEYLPIAALMAAADATCTLRVGSVEEILANPYLLIGTRTLTVNPPVIRMVCPIVH